MTRVAAEVGSAANNYQILAKLAVGGMAEIFLARGASVGGVERYVVLKRILRQRATDVQFVRMFLDEARLAAQLQHPNIAQVYDIGKLGDSYFFTMEYVHGETVRALLHRSHALRRPIHIGSVLTIIAGAAAGLQHAHDRIGVDGRPLGIVHRDISPSNLMVSFEGGVKVVDFGVAKAADRLQETRSGTVKGKISYLSPEQCRGSAVDRRSDLFSLGIVMWEMLTTERLYKRASDFDNMSAIVTEITPLPSTRRPEVSPAVDAIAMRLLAKDPAERYQTAADLIEDLEQHAMSTGSMLSTTSLGKYLRELFGQRPEPWIEMEAADTHGDRVTVMSEPIPLDIPDSSAVALDLQLAGVLDLSSVSQTSGPIEQPFVPSPLALPTVPMMAPRAPLMTAPTMASVPSRMPTGAPTRPMGTTGAVPSLGLHADQLPTTAMPVPVAAPEPMLLRRILVPTIVAGAIIGVVIAIVLSRTPSHPAALVSADVAIAMTSGDAMAIDAGESPPVIAVASADAAVAVASPDAAVLVAVADATPADAERVAAAPADAAVDHVVAVAIDAGVRVPELGELLKAARYDEAITVCSAGRMAADRATLCALAACKGRREPLARRWFPLASARDRGVLISACHGQSIELEPAVVHDAGVTTPSPKRHDAGSACDVDPMACQH